jgi:hypothetical protein
MIMQEGKHLVFYSRKLSSTQTHYTKGEKELQSIVETLKEFRNILLGKDRITRWRLLLEEYGPKYVHIAGKNNIVADALSRLEKDENEHLSGTEEGLVLSHAMCAVEQDEA